ncbi:hypothetical protein [Shewanella woodyi]|uniref:hypothetical protein n=1 Tax=Shewanella woodyi TaxID=60961 RepID=UPI0007F86E4F|nr:hypothetical protein [Shewanella woodyi]
MNEITITEWDSNSIELNAEDSIKYFIFWDSQILQRDKTQILDSTLALQLVAQRVELYDYGIIEAKRNAKDNAWLCKCITP